MTPADEVQKSLNESGVFIAQKVNEAHAKIIGQADDKLDRFRDLKGKLYEDLMVVHDKLTQVKNQVKGNVKND